MTPTRYRVTVEKGACDGVFACLTRDPRFVEDGDGLATVDPADAARVENRGDAVVAEFEDGRIDEARQAAAACPPSAITVEAVATDGGREADDGGER